MPSNQREILDPTNVTLLAELQGDARLTLAELGRRVGLSSPAVAERLQRLQDAGVITGYHAAVDPRAIGYTLGAILRIRPAPRQIAKVAAIAQRTPEVVECHLGDLPRCRPNAEDGAEPVAHRARVDAACNR